MQQSHPFQEEMMRKTKGWTGLRSAVIALGLVAWTATGAMASQLANSTLSYTTSGQVDHDDRRDGHERDQLRSPAQRQLGRPQLGSRPMRAWATSSSLRWPPARSTTYKNTPFQISFLPASYNSDTTVSNDAPVVLTGHPQRRREREPRPRPFRRPSIQSPTARSRWAMPVRASSPCRPVRCFWLLRPPTRARPPRKG